MKNTYLVGGAVRDQLLGLESKDNDFVVVGSSPEELKLAGFKQVGLHFPVFLHPISGDEYALARREKKTGPGYGGFSVEFGTDVTLEEDLARRDLTINSMAVDSDGSIIDPFNGQEDLKNGVLRHVSDAFAEDPLRVLRVMRFIARYNFKVHPDTLALCNKLIDDGELEHLTPERIWKEVSRMLTEPYFIRALKFIQQDLHSFGKNEILTNLFKDADNLLYIPDQRGLTTREITFFYTNIRNLDDSAISFVPTNIIKDVKRMSTLLSMHMTKSKTDSEVFNEAIQKFIDQNRSTLTKDEERSALIEFSKLFKRDFWFFMLNVLNTASDVYTIDFDSILEGVPKDQIQSVVKSTKMKIIKKVFS